MFVLCRVLAALSLFFLLNGATPRARSPEDLYSRRALRRARIIIELRLLELRKERLECVRRAILRNLPPELRPPKSASEGNRPPSPETCDNLFP